jgi:hypothetical protein
MPTTAAPKRPTGGSDRCAPTGNMGFALIMKRRKTVATALAMATGIRLRGFHSKSNNSTASNTAAMGVLNVAAMPAAAPATSSVLRSAAVRCRNCPTSEPKAPPVRMIGPSAPNGPPVPMEIAEEMGLRIASFGSTLLPPTRIVSIASGMPWPRMRSEP